MSRGLVDVQRVRSFLEALAKLERGFRQDLADVDEMIDRGMVRPDELARMFEAIAGELYRFPSVDPDHLRGAVEALGQRRP